MKWRWAKWIGYLVVGIAAVPIALAWGAWVLAGRLVEVVRSLVDVVPCPEGHPNRAYGTWECKTCKATFRGWAFRPCPVCGHSAAFIPCDTCGLSIRAPVRE